VPPAAQQPLVFAVTNTLLRSIFSSFDEAPPAVPMAVRNRKKGLGSLSDRLIDAVD